MEYISKSQKKREAEALQDLGEKLVKLSFDQIDDIDMPEDLFKAVKEAKSIKSHIARRRQMQFIGTVMRKIDSETIQEAIDDIEQGSYKKEMEFKQTEKWRDKLIAGNKELMEEILTKYPLADRQKLSQLVRNAIKEKTANKPPKAFRILFRYLVDLKNKK